MATPRRSQGPARGVSNVSQKSGEEKKAGLGNGRQGEDFTILRTSVLQISSASHRIGTGVGRSIAADVSCKSGTEKRARTEGRTRGPKDVAARLRAT